MAKAPPFEIEITEFKEDPSSGAVFMIFFGISNPERKYDMVPVYFSEEFVQQYFRIPWHKDLRKEASRIIHQKRELFIQWALVRLEQSLRKKAASAPERIHFDYDEDAGWAEKVEKGIIKSMSAKQNETLYFFDPARNL